MAPKWPEPASQRWLKCTKTNGFSTFSAYRLFLQETVPAAQIWPHMAPRWPQNGPKTAPRSPQDGPQTPLSGPSWPQERPKTLPGRRSEPIFCPIWAFLGDAGPFSVPRGPKTAPKWPPRGPKWPETVPQMHPNGPPKDRCLQKSPAEKLPTAQERLPAKLAAELPVGTASNNFLDGGRTLREAVTITTYLF